MKASKLFSILFILFISTTFKAQDTLHLDFGNTQVVPDKPMEDKIVAWGKTLNGKKQDITIVGYYHKGEFKKFAEQRVEEMFLSVNRKVRNLINIKGQETQKGENYQRTRVDIIYYPEGQDAKSLAEKKKAEEKAAKEAEKKKKEEEEKLAKDKGKKDPKDNSSAMSDKKDGKDKKEPIKITPNNKPFVANEEFKSRKMVVVLLSENDKAKEKLAGKADELEAYKANIKLHNDNITKAFEKNWKETKLEFITEDELNKADKWEVAKDAVVLVPGNKEVEKVPFMTYKAVMVYVKGKDLYMNEKEFKVSLAGPAPSLGDYYLLMGKMKTFYNMAPAYMVETQLEEKLKAKTLYIDKDLVELSNEEIKAEYPYAFEVQPAEDIAAMADRMDKNAIYVKTDVAYNPNLINLLFVDAETGYVLSRSSISGLAKVSMNMPSGRFGSSAGFKLGGQQLSFFICTTCALAGNELFRLYTAKPKLKKPMIKLLQDGKKQKKYNNPLVPY